MPDLWCYRLRPQRAFHFGVRGVGVEAAGVQAGSDLLFGALCQAVRMTAGELALLELLAAFRAGRPPFLLSSLFPWAGDVRLLPFPQAPLAIPALHDPRAGKAARKAAYLSWALFGELLAGHGAAFDPAHLAGPAWVTAAEYEALAGFRDPADPDGPIRLWETGDSPRVTVDRVDNRSAVYQVGWVAFREGAGLYFLVDWRDTSWQTTVHTALEYLADDGIGGERSSGFGQFHLDHGADGAPGAPAADLAAPAGAPAAYLTLSLYHPTPAEAGVLAGGWYDLAVRRGWVGAAEALGVRRQDVLLVAEGAVLPFAGPGPFGEMVDVTPATWPPGVPRLDGLLRYGYALPLALSPEALDVQP